MGFFGDFLKGIFGPPRPPAPINPADSSADSLKKLAMSQAEFLASQAIQIYLKEAIRRLPSPERQVQVIDSAIEFLEDYRDLIEEGLESDDELA